MRRHGIYSDSITTMSNLLAIIDTLIGEPDSGFAYMPDYIMEASWPRSVSHKLAYLRVGEDNISRYFSMLRKRSQPLTPSAKAFWNSVVSSGLSPE